jgi:hypothetical protein
MDLTLILTGPNLLLAGGLFVVTTTLKSVFPGFFATKAGQRVLPILPLLLGVLGAFLGFASGSGAWQSQVVMGLLCGFAAANFFKIGKTTVMGWGLGDPVPGPYQPPPTGDPVPAPSVHMDAPVAVPPKDEV